MAEAKSQYPKKAFREIAIGKGRLRTADPPTTLAPEDTQVQRNIRYNRGSLKSIGGQTKINTTATAVTSLKSAVHYRKDFPGSESHFLLGTTSAIYDNTTAIPGQGNFTSLFTPTGAGNPRFSLGPNSSVSMCNGTDSAIWYGTEMPIAGYLDWDAVGNTYKYDYIDQVSNNLTTDFATVHRYAETVDADTVLMLHGDGTNGAQVFTDSSATGHTVTPVGHTNTSTALKKFGTASMAFDGSGDYLSIADHADFNFSSTGSDGDFTIDWQVYWAAFSLPQGTYYYQGTDANNYFKVYVLNDYIYLEIKEASSVVVNLAAYIGYRIGGTAFWKHIELVGKKVGSNYTYTFYSGGSLIGTATDASAPINYTGSVYIGYDGSTAIAAAYIDEFRVSKTYRHTSSFTPPTQAYGSGNTTAIYIGSPLPLQGINWYVQTENTTAGGTPVVYYWDGSVWTSVGTITGATTTPWNGTGKNTWTFASTSATAKQKNIDDNIMFWYKVEATSVDTTTEIYMVTLDAAMQQIVDLWDGIYRKVNSFLAFRSSVYNDYTANVVKGELDTLNEGTFAKIGGFTFATDALYVGSLEQLQGIKFGIQGGFANTNECTMKVEYWDGDSWGSVSPTDGTTSSNISFSQSGTVSWEPPTPTGEFKQTISGTAAKIPISSVGNIPEGMRTSGLTYRAWLLQQQQITSKFLSGRASPTSTVPLYYYKITFTGNGTTTAFPTESTTAGCHVFSVQLIPAPIDCRGYKFPLYHDDSLFLCGNLDAEPNAVIYSAMGRPQVFNGEQSGKLPIGDNTAPVAGCSFSNQFGASIIKTALICKETQTWKISGEYPYEVHPVSFSDGCVAPESMDVGEVELAEGIRRKVAVWVAQRGVVISDGNFIKEISTDIRDLFDPLHSNYLGSSTLPTLYGRIDPVNNEYHLVVPNAAEWVYDFTETKWYETDRGGSGADLNGCVPVYDTNGVAYLYGFTNGGYVMRLDNGTTFASTSSTNNITSTVRLADIALHGASIMFESRINWSSLLVKAKTVTSQSVSETLYVDGETSGTTISTVDPTNGGYVYVNEIVHGERKSGTFHSPEWSITTSDETIGFEPVLWGCNYTIYEREK